MNPAPTKKEFVALSLRVEEIDERVTALEAGKAAKKEKKEKKEGEKRALNPYMQFVQEQREKLKEARTPIPKNFVQQMGVQWRSMTQGVNENTARANQAKNRETRKSRASSRVSSRATSRAASPNKGSASSKKSSAANLVRAAASKLNKATTRKVKVINSNNNSE